MTCVLTHRRASTGGFELACCCGWAVALPGGKANGPALAAARRHKDGDGDDAPTVIQDQLF